MVLISVEIYEQTFTKINAAILLKELLMIWKKIKMMHLLKGLLWMNKKYNNVIEKI